MPEYLSPGVYVEEVSFRSKSIEGVSTSTTAFAGPTSRGPLYFDGQRAQPAAPGWMPLVGAPEIITSYSEFERLFGGFDELSWQAGDHDRTAYCAHAAKAFFDNGGRRLYFARTFVPGATDGTAASAAIGPARFRARFPGSAANGSVTITERRSPASPARLDNAPVGSLARVGGSDVAQPARLESAPLGPGQIAFPVASGATLTLVIGDPAANVNATVTFTGAAAAVDGAELVFPLVLPADTELVVVANDYRHAVPVAAGNYADVNQLLTVVNAGLRRASAVATAGGAGLTIRSDRRGFSSSVAVEANAGLGFAAPANDAGAGSVADLDAVTVAELDQLLQAAGAAATAAISNGRLVLISTAVGTAARLQVDTGVATSAHVAFLLNGTPAAGNGVVLPTYYCKRSASANSWTDASSASLPTGAAAPEVDLVSLSIEARDRDRLSSTVFEDVGLHPQHPRFVGTVLARDPSRRDDALSNLVWLDLGAAPPDPLALRAALLGGVDTRSWELSGGDDGEPPLVARSGERIVTYQNAFDVLAQISDISIVAAPAAAAYPNRSPEVVNALINHAELMRYRFAVVDPPRDQTPSQVAQIRGRNDSTRAAMYYPWVFVPNPNARPGNNQPTEIALPPSGFLCGIYARTDVDRGVWKAPANEIVRSALRFERDIATGVNDVLNPIGVNCLRALPGRGLRVWGGRTMSSDPEWKYVNVRRYFVYLERSIDVSTQWAVFEPNGEALWANVRETVSAFLYNEWRSGALLGARAEDAYFVRCDRSTMTQNDIDNGRLVCLIGVAALKPAEFVIFRIGQKTADART
jgi:phage tail sheath protein FI